MSTEICAYRDRNEDSGRTVYITSFWGGEKDEQCIQITIAAKNLEAQYIQMKEEDFIKMCNVVLKEIRS
jgi:hypothetical protein